MWSCRIAHSSVGAILVVFCPPPQPSSGLLLQNGLLFHCQGRATVHSNSWGILGCVSCLPAQCGRHTTATTLYDAYCPHVLCHGSPLHIGLYFPKPESTDNPVGCLGHALLCNLICEHTVAGAMHSSICSALNKVYYCHTLCVATLFMAFFSRSQGPVVVHSSALCILLCVSRLLLHVAVGVTATPALSVAYWFDILSMLLLGLHFQSQGLVIVYSSD